jgi:hypothetical protein
MGHVAFGRLAAMMTSQAGNCRSRNGYLVVS